MAIERSLLDLWSRVKPILLPFEGAASQLHVLDIPLSALEDCLDKFYEAVANPVLTTINDVSSENSELSTPPSEQKENILSSLLKESTTHIIKGEISKQRSVAFYIWLDREKTVFDVELVFWADEFFRDQNDDVACRKSFSDLVAIAERMRFGHKGCECALTASEAQDPREERGSNWTVFW